MSKKHISWINFRNWNRGHKWTIAWKKGDRRISFNEGGFYFAFTIRFAPDPMFRLFLFPGFPIIIHLGRDIKIIGGWRKYEKALYHKNTAQ